MQKIWYSPKNKVILQPKARNILYGEYKQHQKFLHYCTYRPW